MKGPFNLEIKLPSDPTKSFTVRFLVDVKRYTVTEEYIKNLSDEIYKQGLHLIVILTDKKPSQEVLEYIQNIPQIVLVGAEHRDLVKLLVISLAEIRGEEIDKSLLNRTYRGLIDKFDLKALIEKWIENMSTKGYLLTCEGFVDKTALACRFFINTLGKPMTIEESCEYGWKLRNLLPFGIKSEIIPDMGNKELKGYVEVLKDYGFLKEENGKFHLQQHPAEERIKELLQYYGETTKSTLAKHFIFREAASKSFDSILEHMERKLLIQKNKDNIQLLHPHHIKELKDKISKDFENYKNIPEQIERSFAHILTWKEREWHIISLINMRDIIEDLFKEISHASDEDLVRSRVFIVKELVKWFGYYVQKVKLAINQSKEIVSSLDLEVNNLQEKFNEIYENIKKSIKGIPTKIELQELKEIVSSLNEVKEMLTAEEQINVLENEIERIIGSKKSKDPTRTKHLWTDVDEKMREEKVEGEWTVAKYMLINKKRYEIQEKINNFKKTIKSLEELSQETVNITNEFLKIINEIEMMRHEKLSSHLTRALKLLIENNYIRRLPFPSNITLLTIQELQETIEKHVKHLRNGIDQAKDIKMDIISLNQIENDLIEFLNILEKHKRFYEKFWEENMPKNLVDEKEEILNEYNHISEILKDDNFELIDFNKLNELCDEKQKQLTELNKKAENLLKRYEKLFEEIQHYLTTNLASVQRFKEFVIPKLEKSDKNEIKKILEGLETSYKTYSTWLEDILKQPPIDTSSLGITRTTVLEEERKQREKLIKEIKDLNEYETLILIKIIEFSVSRTGKWLPLTEICKKISQEIEKPPDEVKQIILAISEKEFISLAVGF
jgi:hypothetical protein